MGTFDLGVELNTEQQAMVATAEKFAKEILRPAGIELDGRTPGEVAQADSVLYSVYKKYHELGFHRLIIPKALGGLEIDPLTWNLFKAYGAPQRCQSAGIGVACLIFQSVLHRNRVQSGQRSDADLRSIWLEHRVYRRENVSGCPGRHDRRREKRPLPCWGVIPIETVIYPSQNAILGFKTVCSKYRIYTPHRWAYYFPTPADGGICSLSCDPTTP
jgi:hypothetical protein